VRLFGLSTASFSDSRRLKMSARRLALPALVIAISSLFFTVAGVWATTVTLLTPADMSNCVPQPVAYACNITGWSGPAILAPEMSCIVAGYPNLVVTSTDKEWGINGTSASWAGQAVFNPTLPGGSVVYMVFQLETDGNQEWNVAGTNFVFTRTRASRPRHPESASEGVWWSHGRDKPCRPR
jgi:hypothetical protein